MPLRGFAVPTLVLVLLALIAGPSTLSANPDPQAATSGPGCFDNTCYNTNAEIQIHLQQIAQTYPQLATLTSAGLSWEGARNLWLLRLGSGARPAPRPGIYLVAAQRPRDIAGPEMLLRYAYYLVQNYGTDPDVTWLLDNRDVWLMPVANPDGYYQVYYNGQCLRYKNTDSDDGCTNPLTLGVDLNRNYPYQWNTGGTSSNPCDSSYPGPSALSEPESQHILSSFVASEADLMLQLQAPGPWIRYPWGYSQTPSPDAAGLDALAWNLGRLNGTPRNSVSQHSLSNEGVISGILDDTVYGQYGVPAMTLSIGATQAPVCATLETLWAAQRPALLYAAKAVGLSAATTLSRPFGPTPGNLAAAEDPARLVVTFTAVLSSNYGTVQGAVYTIDAPGEDGAGLPMSGNFGGGTAAVSAVVATSGLPNGRHLLFAQGKNGSDRWGVHSAVFFTVTGSAVTATPTSLALTPSATGTATPTRTQTRTPTRTQTPTITNTATLTPTSTFTRTQTRTSTPTPTPITGTSTPTPVCSYGIYQSTDVPRWIPNPGTTTSTLTLTTSLPVADLDVVGLDVQHDFLDDLTLSLTSPDGTTVVLVDRACGSYNDLPRINFDDGAPGPIACPPVLRATYRPEEPLSAFNGLNSAGVWSLTLTDHSGSNVGLLWAWGLSVTYGAACYTPTPTPTVTPTGTITPTGTRTATSTRTATFTRTTTPTRTETPTYAPTYTRTPTATRTPRPPSSATPLPCEEYTDVSPGQYFYQAVDWLTCRHIVSGYSDRTFRPFNPATRAQLVKMVVLGEEWALYTPSRPTFSDVQPTDWFYSVVETAAKHGIIAGYGDGTFHPYNNVTRGQLCKIIALARLWPLLDPEVPSFSDVPRGSAFYTYVQTALAHAVVSGYGDGTFRPHLDATRGQLSKMLYVAWTEE